VSRQVDDFHKLEHRICLAGKLVTRTGLRIGSGGSSELDAVDLPVLKDAGGFPLIPGSSIKGVLRSTIESLIRGAGLPADSGLWACDPLSKESCGYHESGKRTQVKTDEHCTVCQMLGSHIVASHVRFTDALVPTEDRQGRIPIETRDGVAIDRDLRVASGGKKYNFEVVSPGTQFALEVFADNAPPFLMGLLVIGFEQIAEGFTALGGFTSRGLGRTEIHWSHLTKVTARELLNGLLPKKVEGAALAAQFEDWRSALAVAAGATGGK